MNQVVHIFRKDCRRLWRIIAAVLMLTCLHGYGEVINPGIGSGVAIGFSPGALLFLLAGLSGSLLPIALFLLVVSVVQEESLVGSDKFWLTRPYSRRSLFLEKLLFIVLWAVLPMLLHDVILIRHFGFPLSSAFGLLVWKSAQFCFFLLFAAAFAVLSASFGGAVLRAIGAIVVILMAFLVVFQDSEDRFMGVRNRILRTTGVARRRRRGRSVCRRVPVPFSHHSCRRTPRSDCNPGLHFACTVLAPVTDRLLIAEKHVNAATARADPPRREPERPAAASPGSRRCRAIAHRLLSFSG